MLTDMLQVLLTRLVNHKPLSNLPCYFIRMSADFDFDFDAFLLGHQFDHLPESPASLEGFHYPFENGASSSSHSQLLAARKEGDGKYHNEDLGQDPPLVARSVRWEEKLFCGTTDVDSFDISTLAGSPPPMSMSASSTSNSCASSAFSSPIPPPGSAIEISSWLEVETLSSFPRISRQKLEVLRYAMAWNQHPTEDEFQFLVAALSLHANGRSPEQLLHALQQDERFHQKCLPPNTYKHGRPVALWKQNIVRHARQREPAPSKSAVKFLVAGLRISVEEFWDTPMVYWKQLDALKTKPKKSIALDISSKKRRLRTAKVFVQSETSADLNPAKQATSVECVITQPGTTTYKISSLGSPPWNPLMNSNPKPTAPVDASSPIQKPQYPPLIVQNLGSLSNCEKSEALPSEDVKMEDSPNTQDTPIDSVCDEGQYEDEETELGLLEEVAAILGPEYSHLAEFLVSRFGSEPLSDLFQSEYGTRQRPEGAGSTPSSTSSQTPGNASSPNTTESSSSGSKRKSPGDGSGGGGDPDDTEGDGNGGVPPLPKRIRKPPSSPQPKFDCPIYRSALRTGGKIHVCAPNGLEFRNLWYANLDYFSVT
jgi:hypothetical protein